MFDAAFKAYTNLKLSTVEQPKEDVTSGLLSRTQPMPRQDNMEARDERTRVAGYVSNIRAKREALKNG